MKMNDMSQEELLALQASLEADPKNRNPPGDFWTYTKPMRAKLDKIRWLITQHMRQKRIAEGRPPNDAGYSGRNSNKR